MPEHIERNALLADIEKTVIFSGKTGQSSLEIRGANKVISRINTAPTADVVEVVRCRNCEHWNNGDCFRIEMTRADDFCSFGKRKDGIE